MTVAIAMNSEICKVHPDGATLVTEKKAGVVAKSKQKVYAVDGGLGFWTFHCIIYGETLSCMSLRMDHVMEVDKTVNFIRVRG